MPRMLLVMIVRYPEPLAQCRTCRPGEIGLGESHANAVNTARANASGDGDIAPVERAARSSRTRVSSSRSAKASDPAGAEDLPIAAGVPEKTNQHSRQQRKSRDVSQLIRLQFIGADVQSRDRERHAAARESMRCCDT